MSIVITGATGNLGRLVIEELLARGQRVAGIVRDAEKAADLATRGLELRVADYERPETLHETFRQGERALLISSNAMGRNVAQHAAVIEAASADGVELLAYTSVLGGPKATFAIAEPTSPPSGSSANRGCPTSCCATAGTTRTTPEPCRSH
jgi:NAD(P)H dehydrogenase (quinone)